MADNPPAPPEQSTAEDPAVLFLTQISPPDPLSRRRAMTALLRAVTTEDRS